MFGNRIAKCTSIVTLFLVFMSACANEQQNNSNTSHPVPATNDKQITGTVVSVHDGDTITVFDGNEKHKIRLDGIDAPESDQEFGSESQQYLSSIILNKTVTVFTHKIDQHGRPVGKVIYDGVDVDLELLKAGLAWHYKQYQNEQSPIDRTTYTEAEITARAAKLGLWVNSNAIPPWDFRHAKDDKNVEDVPKGAIIGNKNSMIYHTPGCSTCGKVSPQNQVIFKNIQEAEAAGYRRAKNCRGG